MVHPFFYLNIAMRKDDGKEFTMHCTLSFKTMERWTMGQFFSWHVHTAIKKDDGEVFFNVLHPFFFLNLAMKKDDILQITICLFQECCNEKGRWVRILNVLRPFFLKNIAKKKSDGNTF